MQLSIGRKTEGELHEPGATLEEARSTGLYMSSAAARLSASLVAVVCTGYGGLTYVGAVQNFSTSDAVLSLLYTLGILLIQLGYFSRPGVRLRAAYSAPALVGLAALVYLPALHLREFWTGFSGFLAGSLLIALAPRWGAAAFVVVVAASSQMQRTFGQDPLQPTFAIAYTVVSTAITGLVIFGLTRLARLVRHLHDAREELSHMAVAEERLRFSRDAHDLLGMSLSAITLTAELAHRLVPTEPERAQEELRELLVASRRALAEVRMVAAGYTEMSLAEELFSAQKVLAAADIATTMHSTDLSPPDDIGTLFATFVREAVTNVLRHSKADVCVVTFSLDAARARLVVSNDGAGEGAGVTSTEVMHAHRGINNLKRRFEDRGGEVRVDRHGEEFLLIGTLPLAHPDDRSSD